MTSSFQHPVGTQAGTGPLPVLSLQSVLTTGAPNEYDIPKEELKTTGRKIISKALKLIPRPPWDQPG